MRTITELRQCSCHNCKRKLDAIFWQLIQYNFPNERIPTEA